MKLILKKENSIEIKSMPGRYLYEFVLNGTVKLIILVDILQRLQVVYRVNCKTKYSGVVLSSYANREANIRTFDDLLNAFGTFDIKEESFGIKDDKCFEETVVTFLTIIDKDGIIRQTAELVKGLDRFIQAFFPIEIIVDVIETDEFKLLMEENE